MSEVPTDRESEGRDTLQRVHSMLWTCLPVLYLSCSKERDTLLEKLLKTRESLKVLQKSVTKDKFYWPSIPEIADILKSVLRRRNDFFADRKGRVSEKETARFLRIISS